ncbi:MAG: response regulator [Vicinamibacterales bacterium]
MSRILLVEDDATIAAIMRAVLARGGWELRHAATGEAALAIASEWHPALILLDVELPGMNGFSVCSTVRASDQGEHPLIVMVTSNDDVASKLTGFKVGADDYLVKPVDPQELLTRVSKLLGDREAQERAIKQRRREAMNELVATVCHEINNPLAAAVGYLELLEQRELPPDVREGLAGTHEALLRVADVIARLKGIEDRPVQYLGEVAMIDLPTPADPSQVIEEIDPDDPEGLDKYFP